MTRLLSIFKRFFKSPFQRYRIVHDPEIGYMAQHFEDGTWWGIYENGVGGVDESIIRSYHQFYSEPTIEGAGKRINKHASARTPSVVWKG